MNMKTANFSAKRRLWWAVKKCIERQFIKTDLNASLRNKEGPIKVFSNVFTLYS